MGSVTLKNNTISLINIDDIVDYYVIVFKDLNDDYKMYFTFYDYNKAVLKISGKNPALDIPIACNYKNEGYFISEFGEIDSVINLQDLIVTYFEIKKVYSIEEIKSILENYSQDYINLMQHENVKKLNKKYVGSEL